MKTLLILLCSVTILLSNTINYDLIIEDRFNNALFDVTQNNNENISAVGFTRIRASTSTSQSFDNPFDYLASKNTATGEQIRLVELNNNAKIIKDLSFKLPRFNRATSILKLSNNDYYIGGYTLDGELILTRMSANGSIVFQTLFGTKNYDRMNQLVQLRDGGVLAVGSSITSRSFSDPLFSGGLGLNDIYLTRFSRAGEKLWSKKYGTLDDDNGISAVEAIDGTIMVIATTSKGKNKNVILLRVSEEGDKIWLKKYTSEGIYEAHNIIRLRDNTFLASINVSKDAMQKTRLVIFDMQKNIIQDVEISASQGFSVNDIKQHSDGTFSVAGQKVFQGDVDAIALHLDSSLDIIWEKSFSYPGYNTLYGLDIQRNSDIVFVGTRSKYLDEVSNMWIIKLSKKGEFILLQGAKTFLYQALLEEFKHELYMNKIEISKNLTISFNASYMKFKVSQYKLTQKQEQFLENFSPRLFKLLDTYHSIVQGVQANGYTSKEWNNSSIDSGYLKNSDLSFKRAQSVHSFMYLHVNNEMRKWIRTMSKANANAYSKQLKIESTNRDAREVTLEIKLKI